jgi:hypothetical protein
MRYRYNSSAVAGTAEHLEIYISYGVLYSAIIVISYIKFAFNFQRNKRESDKHSCSPTKNSALQGLIS